MKGHVFIVRGDLTRLACDAWLVPCDGGAKPESNWRPPCCEKSLDCEPFKEGQRVQKVHGWPDNCPQPWLVDVGGDTETEISWYMEGVRQFLEMASSHLAGKVPLFGRARPLLALPVVGTGLGGALERAGAILEGMLLTLRAFTEDNAIDAAVVAFDPDIYAAAQAERARANVEAWPDLDPELKKQADSLAEISNQGKLAIFIGAGVSKGAGLPDWNGLLRDLTLAANRRDDECKAIEELDNPLDQASIIERWLKENDKSIGMAVAENLQRYHHGSLSHLLLASLPVSEVITTNYDQLFEMAWKIHDRDGISVLPGEIKSNTRRWLLKMHGCLSRPEQIVLTRSSYNRYDESLPGFAGIVEAFLITRHMLFVGFSLSDDNFHRIVDCVRQIRAGSANGHYFGTVLFLRSVGLQEILWDKDLHMVRMVQGSEQDSVSDPEAARRLEIFMDYLLSRTRDTSHLLVGERFDNILNESERHIRDALHKFVTDLQAGGESIKETVAWRHIERTLKELGFTTTEEASSTCPDRLSRNKHGKPA